MSKSKDQPKVDLDRVLVEEVGQFDKFQVLVAVHCVVAVIFMAWTANEFNFSSARIKTRCLVPECEDELTEFAPGWLPYALPTSGNSYVYDSCQRFGNISRADNGTCSAGSFDTTVVYKCEHHVYENDNTLVYDFGLACQEWHRTLVGTVRVLGIISALPLFGIISDRWGRKLALSIATFGAPCIGITRYWVTSYNVYVAVLFVETLFGGASMSCSIVLLPEWLSPKFRPMGVAIVNTGYSVGQVLLGIIAWSVPNWRNLTLALCIPQFICITFFWTLQESARWYLSKGKFTKAEDLLKKAAQTNGKSVSDGVLKALRVNAESELKRKEDVKSRPCLILLVLRNKQTLLRCVVTPVWWFAMQLVYYGLSVNVISLSGSMHWNYVAVVAVEIPGFWAVSLLIDRLGRKPLLIMALLTCAASQAAFILIPKDLFIPSLCSYMLGKFAIAAVMTTTNIYTLELYPTEYRHRFFAYSIMIGRSGSVLAPLTPGFAAVTFESLPFVMFGCTAALAAALTLLVPETRGTRLPDTLEEAEQIGKSAPMSL